jgi:hypothetical protein
MAQVTKTRTYSSGGQLTASNYNADRDEIIAGVNTIDTAQLNSNAITTAKIADSNITTAKIVDDAITTAKIVDDAITTAKIADSNITTAKIADSNVTTAKIADSNVTLAKLSNVKDEDDMSSNSDTALATQQSIKAYVDNNGVSDPLSVDTINESTGGNGVTVDGLNIKDGVAQYGDSMPSTDSRFRVHLSSSQSVTSGALRTVEFDTTGTLGYDPDTIFNTTNNNFSPNVSGYYDVSSILRLTNSSNLDNKFIIYQLRNTTDNTSIIQEYMGGSNVNNQCVSFSGVVYLNSSKTYEAQLYPEENTTISDSESSTFLSVHLLST